MDYKYHYRWYEQEISHDQSNDCVIPQFLLIRIFLINPGGMLDVKKTQDRGDAPWLAVEDYGESIAGIGNPDEHFKVKAKPAHNI